MAKAQTVQAEEESGTQSNKLRIIPFNNTLSMSYPAGDCWGFRRQSIQDDLLHEVDVTVGEVATLQLSCGGQTLS